jgi:hypothetical protein
MIADSSGSAKGFALEVRFRTARLEEIARAEASPEDLPNEVKEAFLGTINWFDHAVSEQDLEVLRPAPPSGSGTNGLRHTSLTGGWSLTYQVAGSAVTVGELLSPERTK